MHLGYYQSGLKDSAVIREVLLDGTCRLINGLASLSAESRMARFFYYKHTFSLDELNRLSSPSDGNHLKRVAVILDENHTEEIVGLARCDRLGAIGPIADFGIVVRDGFTRSGIGTRLATELGKASQAVGITHWRADFFATNLGSEKLLRSVGREEQREDLGSGIVRATIALTSWNSTQVLSPNSK